MRFLTSACFRGTRLLGRRIFQSPDALHQPPLVLLQSLEALFDSTFLEFHALLGLVGRICSLQILEALVPVSYTHLTLPTKRIV